MVLSLFLVGKKLAKHIVTKAKKNCIAYEYPVKKHGRVRPPKKGNTVKLNELFEAYHDAFKTT